ncbi:hypothetical protein [Caenispirillum bisanense]|uniref:hypothetical protein n=1 Tax=Caenispirillum bisanense TaxID=414052 RepID=UPI0031DAE350
MTRGMVINSFKPPRNSYHASSEAERGLRPRADRFAANEEPSIAELMGDPIMDALLARDGLHRDLVHRCIAEARARLG